MTEERTARDRLLDAALETAAIHGLARLSVGDVAKAAGLSRQTLYKHFPSKEALIAETILREAQRMVDVVLAAADAEEDPERSLEVAILTTLRVTREHPLLDRLVRTEPEALLPFLVADGGVVGTAVRSIVERLLDQDLPGISAVARRRVADLASRLLISYAINAPDDPPEVVAEALAQVLTGGLAYMLTGELPGPLPGTLAIRSVRPAVEPTP